MSRTICTIFVLLLCTGTSASSTGTETTHEKDERLVQIFNKTQQDLTSNLLNYYAAILEEYKKDCGRYPTTEQGLKALREEPKNEPLCDAWGPKPYAFRLVEDAWGKPFVYQAKPDGKYELTSLGKDQAKGGTGYQSDLIVQSK